MRGNTGECIGIAVVSKVKEFQQPRTEPKAEIPEKVFRGRFELPSSGEIPDVFRLHYRKKSSFSQARLLIYTQPTSFPGNDRSVAISEPFSLVKV